MAVVGMGVMYLCGALATLGYNRLMVQTSQKVVREIRMRSVPAHTKTAHCGILMRHTRGEINEPFYQRCRCGAGGDEQQFCNDHPEFS
ncbi:MAG: hypothetical protein ACLTH3_02210 [Lachnospira sp.]